MLLGLIHHGQTTMSHNQSATREIKKYILIYSIYTRQQQCKWAKIGKVVQVVDA